MAVSLTKNPVENQPTRAAGRALRLYSFQFREDRFFWGILIASAFAHLIFLSVSDLTWLREPAPLVEEWAIDADLISDFDPGMPDKDTMPDAKKAEQMKVAENLLPQLPKKFALKNDTVKQNELGEELDKEKLDKKKDVREEKADDNLNVKTDPNEANRLKKDDALKRLAMERLRAESKKAKQLEAPENDPLARLRAEIARNKKLNSGETGAGVARTRLYRSILQRAVRRNYALPEAYNLKDAKLRVVIHILVSERGDLMKLEVHQSSGDNVFDDLALKVVKSSTPLPRPPKGLVAESIYLQFTPKSF